MDIKVGIFDSGIGGKSVENELDRLSKQLGVPLQIDYLADTENFPYGRKTKIQLESIIKNNIEYLMSRGNMDVIVACNTASIAGEQVYEIMSETHDVSIVRVVDAVSQIKEEVSRFNKVLVIGSEFTINSDYYYNKLKFYSPTTQIIQSPMQDLIAFIELNDKDNIQREVKSVGEIIEAEGVDAILLGCTHYSFVKKEFLNLPGEFAIIDPSSLTAISYLRKHVSINSAQTKISNYAFDKMCYLNLYE